MLDQLLGAVEYGGYISLLKLIGYMALFFAWLPLIGWVFRDARILESNEVFWSGLVLGVGGAAAIIWLVIPVYLGGMIFYLVAVGGAALAYIKHRNGRVLDYDRVLTVDHIKSLLANKEKKLAALKSFTFVTSNKNEIDLPEPRTADFFGYKTSYDILHDAIWRRASSVAFSPTAEDYKVSYFVDGTSLKQPSLSREQMGYFITFIKELAGLDPKERRKPQKGRFQIRRGKDDMPWEVTTAGSTAGEQVRLKHIEQETISKLNEIGLMPEQLEQLSQLRGVKQGVVILSGPKQCGVTTSLYALLRNHDAFLNSVNTLERQPSGDLPNITQNVYALGDTGTTSFGAKLQSMMRMGPDIVGVADCEDAETARVVSVAAKDGKLVYVTLKADSVLQALGKWMKLVGDKNLVAETLLCASNQRLLRKLCEECKQGYAPEKELFRKFNITADKTKVLYRAGKVQYDKHGKPLSCDHCQGTGYFDRTGIFELAAMNDELRKAVRKAKTLPEIGAHLRRAKMLYLQEQVLRKVIAGTASINEMIRALGASKTKKAKPTQ